MPSTSTEIAISSLVSAAVARASGVGLGGDAFVLAWCCGLRLCPCEGAGSKLADDEIWYCATAEPARQQEIVAIRVAQFATHWYGARAYGRDLVDVAHELLGRDDVDFSAAVESPADPLRPAPAAYQAAINAGVAADARALGARRLATISALRPAHS
jgi:hypothetical protein